MPLFRQGSPRREEVLYSVSGRTHTLVGGNVETTELAQEALFLEQKTASMGVGKFTLPNVREGSVVEFSYSVRSDFLFTLNDWDFQRAIPVRWSEYKLWFDTEFHLPGDHAGLRISDDQQNGADTQLASVRPLCCREFLWLECTDPHDPAGYAGGFTGNRQALLLTPEGGHLVRTPRYAAADNRQVRRATVTLAESGDATVELTTRYAGLQQDERSQVMTQLGRDDQRTWITQQIEVPSFELNDFQLSRTRTRLPEVTEVLRLLVRKWASRSGERLFVPLNLLSASTYVPPGGTERQTEFEIQVGYTDMDSVTILLPPDRLPEFQPEPMQLTSRFGTYTAQVGGKAGTLTYVRRLELTAGRYPAADYAAYVAFRRAIAKADRAQVVLIPKKT